MTVLPTATVREAIQCIDRGGRCVALVVDDAGLLITTITDGDIRRAILAGIDTAAPVGAIREMKAGRGTADPISAPAGTHPVALIELMHAHGIRQVPLLDDGGRVVDLVTLDELLPTTALPLSALIVAGGLGSRLLPLTQHTPKTMLPVGDRPLLEWIVGHLRNSGISRICVATHHLGHLIRDHFGDGRHFGVDMTYVDEPTPLGTAGALGLVDLPETDTLVMLNGDILTRVNFAAMLQFHLEHQADMTIAVSSHDVRIPFGVVDCDGPLVRGIEEKPALNFLVCAGIYMISGHARRLVPPGQRVDAPELARLLIERARTVVSFPIVEYWLDLGKRDDYDQAQTDVTSPAFAGADQLARDLK